MVTTEEFEIDGIQVTYTALKFGEQIGYDHFQFQGREVDGTGYLSHYESSKSVESGGGYKAVAKSLIDFYFNDVCEDQLDLFA